MDKEKVIGQIYETMNYDQFEIINGNRKIDHSTRIGKSIDKNGALLSPIIVNEKMQIIDGQNRFTALKERKLPISYIICQGYGIEQVRALNEYTKNWALLDYIRSYADEGCTGCSRLLVFLNKYRAINRSALIEIAVGKNVRFSELEELKTFDFANEPYATKVAEALIALKEVDINDQPVYKRREFSRAIFQVLKVEGFELDTLITKIKLQPRKFVPCGNPAQYIDMLEELYNFRNKKPLHFDF